jgi:hypothetical protein
LDFVPCALGSLQPLGIPHQVDTYFFYYKIASSAIRVVETLNHLLNNSLINHWNSLKICTHILLGLAHLLEKFGGFSMDDFIYVIH